MACGAALFHLKVALHHFGYAGKVRTFPKIDEPDLLARVGFGDKKRPTVENDTLFDAILKRRTNRLPFDPRKIPDNLLKELEAAVGKHDAWLHIVRDENDRNKIADLVAEGDRIQMASPSFRRELAAWIHPNRSASHDGMPGYALGLSSLTSSFAPMVVRTFDMGKGQAAKDRQLATGSPALAILDTDADAQTDWLTAGEAMDDVLLRARAGEIWASFLNQPIEVAELRRRLRDQLNLGVFHRLF
jgi:hypothetical protein